MSECAQVHLRDRLDDRTESKCNAVVNQSSELIEITLADEDFTARVSL